MNTEKKATRKNPNAFKVMVHKLCKRHLGEINSDCHKDLVDRIALEEEVAKLIKRKMQCAFEAAKETSELLPRPDFSVHTDFNKWFNETQLK